MINFTISQSHTLLDIFESLQKLSTINLSTQCFLAIHITVLLHVFNGYHKIFSEKDLRILILIIRILKSGVFRSNKINLKNYLSTFMCINKYQNQNYDLIKDFGLHITQRNGW